MHAAILGSVFVLRKKLFLWKRKESRVEQIDSRHIVIKIEIEIERVR